MTGQVVRVCGQSLLVAGSWPASSTSATGSWRTGPWTKAHALAAMESRLPAAYAVDVVFSQPLLLPSVAHLLVAQQDQGWDFAIRPAQGAADHLRGTVRTI